MSGNYELVGLLDEKKATFTFNENEFTVSSVGNKGPSSTTTQLHARRIMHPLSRKATARIHTLPRRLGGVQPGHSRTLLLGEEGQELEVFLSSLGRFG